MRFLLVLTLLINNTLLVEAQNIVIDSLKNELHQNPERREQRVKILNELSYRYWIVDPVEAEKYSREALSISEDMQYKSGKAFAYRSIGVTNWAQGNYEEGLAALMQSLELYKQMQDTLNIANAMMNTGLIYSEQFSFEEALAYYLEALKTFNLLDRQERAVNTLNHIGELYQKQKDHEKAYEYFQQALSLSFKSNHSYGKSTAYSNLANYFKDVQQLDSALIYSNKALQIQRATSDLNGKTFSLYTIGLIYYLKSNYTEAEDYLLRALAEAESISSKKMKQDIYFKLQQVATKQGNYKKALNYYQDYTNVKDSLFNADKLREFVRLENKYELEKSQQKMQLKEQELEIVQQESELNKLWRQTLLIGIVALILISYFIYSRQRINIKRKNELLLKNQQIYDAREALTVVELENAKLKEEELNQKIAFKNKELTSYTLNFMQKNELMEELKEAIKEIKKSPGNDVGKKLGALNKMVTNSMQIDKDWQDFKRHFEEVHTDFFTRLKSKFPDITSNELKLCALLKLNMNLKEAASIMGISPESVKTARYRLRKKLQLSKEDNLVEYIINLEKEIV
ncbi:tetratricopeptide repeat protein [Marivirga lumbricoides]